VSSDDEPDNREEWDGILETPEIDHEAEYIDEDRYTTVTVEAMDLTKDGLHRAAKEAEENSFKEGKLDGTNTVPTQKQGKRIWTKGKPEKEGQASKAKRKRKKFRYENKTERRMTRFKEKAKNSKQAKARRSD
jgi:ribosomal RNA-processing protein 17